MESWAQLENRGEIPFLPRQVSLARRALEAGVRLDARSRARWEKKKLCRIFPSRHPSAHQTGPQLAKCRHSLYQWSGSLATTGASRAVIAFPCAHACISAFVICPNRQQVEERHYSEQQQQRGVAYSRRHTYTPVAGPHLLESLYGCPCSPDNIFTHTHALKARCRSRKVFTDDTDGRHAHDKQKARASCRCNDACRYGRRSRR